MLVATFLCLRRQPTLLLNMNRNRLSTKVTHLPGFLVSAAMLSGASLSVPAGPILGWVTHPISNPQRRYDTITCIYRAANFQDFQSVQSRLFSSTGTTSSINKESKKDLITPHDTNIQESSPDYDILVDRIKQAYDDQETDGILSLSRADPRILHETPPRRLIELSIESVQGHPKQRAAAAGIINGFLGSCALLSTGEEEAAADLAKGLWNAIMEQNNNKDNQSTKDIIKIDPDVVTHCLAYYTIHLQDPTTGKEILDLALKASKKQAGSKRRKALAAARRRTSGNADKSSTVEDFERKRKQLEVSLREVLGDTGLRILEDTDDYIILDKPGGVTCYQTAKTTAGKISKKKARSDDKQRDISLEDALLHCGVPLSTLNPICQGLVHRIDRGTSGCMIWSKTNEMHAKLVSAFFLRQVKKQYVALVSPAPAQLYDHNTSSERTRSILVDYPVHGHAAQSQVTLLESFRIDTNFKEEASAALLKVEPSTGRRHQVRVHCAEELCAPILLDPLYVDKEHQNHLHETLSSLHPKDMQPESRSSVSSPSQNSKKAKSKKGRSQQLPAPTSQRFFLQASSLSIPTLGIEAQSELPECWNDLLDRLSGRSSS